MSNKRQLKMSASKRLMAMAQTFILRCDLKSVSSLNFLKISFMLLLLTSTVLIVESAKLESQTEINTGDSSQTLIKSASKIIKIATTTVTNVDNNDDDNEFRHHSDNIKSDDNDALTLRQKNKENTLDEAAENFYHSELQRLSYDTIHSILRDENEPIYRRDDNDRRYYHTKSLQPTHEIMKREAALPEEVVGVAATTPTTHHFKSYVEIDLSSKLLRTINITAYEHFSTLNLSHNQLSDIQLTTNSTIVVLNLNSNRIVKAEVVWNNHLKALYLRDNQIEDVTALNLSQLVALEILDLSCNRIRNLELSFFPQLMHNLKYLNLAQNNLATISRETFYHLPSLNTLLLAYNNITSIDYETFLSLPSLQYLDLSHNQLKAQSIRALQGIPYLIGLSIAFNGEVGESLQEFVASWSLNEVDASGTGLCQIPAALVQSVRTLKLADNWLKIINCGDLDSYPLLTQLDLSNSRIEDIEDDAMGRLECLELLFLDHNRLRKVPVSLPTSLEHLFLHNNEIMDLQVQAFQGLKNLKTLDLSHNKLLYLPALPLPKLLTLNLQASGLQGLNQAIVHTLPHLRDLLLEENPIKCSDLLGIAEWASPCRIADRTTMTMAATMATLSLSSSSVVKNADDVEGEQIASSQDVGQLKQQQQQQMQTVAKIDLKAKFVQTHNFYEKFAGSLSSYSSGRFCSCIAFGSQMAAARATSTATPPACAIELDDEVLLKVEKPTTENIFAAAETSTTKQPNLNFNEQHKISQVEKSTVAATKAPFAITTTTLTPNMQPTSKGITKNANHAATKMPPTTTAKTFQTENIVIANKTSEGSLNLAHPAAVILPTKLSAKNTKKAKLQISSSTTVKPTTTSTTSPETTSTLATTLIKKSPATNLTTKMTTAAAPALVPVSTTTQITNLSASSSLLERQRRLDAAAVETFPASTSTTTMQTTVYAVHQAKNLARNIGNNVDSSQNSPLQRKSSNNFVNSNVEQKNENPATTSTPIAITTTTIGQQHKHVTLQLNSKDRHLIGTPLLTHLGQNLMIAAEELKKNGNHKIDDEQAKQENKENVVKDKIAENVTTIANLDKSQQKNQQKEKEVNKFQKEHVAATQAWIEAETTTSASITTTTTTTSSNMLQTAANAKSNKKQLNELKKKPTTLIMKKMTITTNTNKQHPQISTATSTKIEEIKARQQREQTQPPPPQHHYNLNMPRENEATFGYLVTSAAAALNYEKSHTNSITNKHHSTVNTPIINHGHEIEPQTFQEHNEIIEEEEQEAAAARASISAKFNSKLHAAAHHHQQQQQHSDETTTGWAAVKHNRLHFDNPALVFIVGIALFVTLVLSLLHAYRCKMPEIFNMQRNQQQQQRPHQQLHQNAQQQQQPGQRMRTRNKPATSEDSHSFLNEGSNQFQRQWRLERAVCNQQQQQQPQHQHQHQSIQQHSSPFHNLQVRELQQTSAIEPCPKYCKPSYNISSALGARASTSQTTATTSGSSNSNSSSSACSPNSSAASCTFDDETCYIEMTTTDVGQTFTTSMAAHNSNQILNAAAVDGGDLLPMELLSIKRATSSSSRYDSDEVNVQQNQNAASSSPMQPTIQTSAIDESSTMAHILPSTSAATKLTPSTRKLGLW